MENTPILIVDDEAGQRNVLAGYLRRKYKFVHEASSAGEAITRLRDERIDIVLTDYRMPGMTGFDLLKEVRTINPEAAVVIMTAFGTVEGAVDAMRAGAFDYLTKPINLDELDLLVRRIIERRMLMSENRLLKEELAGKFSFEGIVSRSEAMERVLNTAARVAPSTASVLIRGESGTGKELVAKAIHYASPRKEQPFVAVNCAALNENLLESELFGHERGAFTGADRLRRGRFEIADGGTLFLDEIGDIPPSTQVRLLRVLQERRFERVGGTEAISVDVRVIAATNKNLEEAIRAERFREDLFYRLNVVSIGIPPLRERRDDIPPTLDHFLRLYAREHRPGGVTFSREAWDLLVRYDYPGNVRELQNIIQRAVILSRGNTITTEELPEVVRGLKPEGELRPPEETKTLPGEVEKLEKELLFEALRLSNGNQSRAAKQLGISERNLRYRLKKWGIK